MSLLRNITQKLILIQSRDQNSYIQEQTKLQSQMSKVDFSWLSTQELSRSKHRYSLEEYSSKLAQNIPQDKISSNTNSNIHQKNSQNTCGNKIA